MTRLLPQYRLRTAIVIVAVACAMFAWFSSWHKNAKQAVTGVYLNANHSNNPEWASIHVLENDFNEPIAVLIHHGQSTEHGPSFTPVMFDSNLRWKTHYPPNAQQTGVWIDGEKQPLGTGLAVFYVTEKSGARYVDISSNDQATFLTEARLGGDPLEFVQQWIHIQ